MASPFADQAFARRPQFIPHQVTNRTLTLPTAGISLLAASNLFDKGPQFSATLVMPTTDADGNALSDGLELGISFGDAIQHLTLSGPFRNAPPISVGAGQVLNFRYSTITNSWWNA